MKKYKFSNQKASAENVGRSAFAAYKSANSVSSGKKLDNMSSVASTSQNIGEMKIAIPTSSGLMRHISNKTSFSFRKSTKKYKKKLRKQLEPTREETCTMYAAPAEPDKASALAISSNSVKSTAFPFGNGKTRASLTSDKKTSKRFPAPKVYENHKASAAFRNIASPKRKYKDDRSIELSTSKSLTGYEDNDSEDGVNNRQYARENLDPNSNTLKVTPQEGMEMSANILNDSGSPMQKKLKVDTEEEEDQSQSTLDAKSFTGKISSRHSSPYHAVNATSAPTSIRKATSKIMKMPSPDGNSQEDGKLLLKWLIHPMGVEHFMSTIWEKKPALIRRHIPTYVTGVFSTEEFNRILHECNVQYGVNLDVTSFQDGVRETHNLEGKVYPVVVWDNYKNGCSIRMKNPQAFSKPVWKICATLQEYFRNFVGANIYLTPPGTQGFAPHYDDIEAFVLQLEGKKHWRLYNPRSRDETLPRYSSPNFTDEDIGNQIFDAVLEPGDLLYFPRGYIHQAQAVPDAHSLHITISTYQRNSWADVLNELVPKALQRAIDEDLEFRRGLPLDYLSCMGYHNKQTANPQRRKEIFSKVSDLFKKLADFADVDENADQRGKNFLHDCLPPALAQDERARTVLGATVRLSNPGRPGSCQCDIDLNTNVRIIRKNSLRLVKSVEAGDEEGTFFVYHCMQNPRSYHTEEQKYFAITEDCASVLEFLINSYPDYRTVKSFPLPTDDDKVNVAYGLFEKGILLMKDKVKLVADDDCGTAV